MRKWRIRKGVLLGAAATLALVPAAVACDPPPAPPATMTYNYVYSVNVHDQPSGFSHLYNHITITVDPYGTVTNMTSALKADSYGVESAAAYVVPEGNGSVFQGQTVNITGWETSIVSSSRWSVHYHYLWADWVQDHCTWKVVIKVRSGGGKKSSYAYPTNQWSGSCDKGALTLSKAT